MSVVLLMFPCSSSIVFLSIVAVIAIIIMNLDSDDTGTNTLVGGGVVSGPVKKTNLPVDSMLKKGTQPWNTQYIGNPERLTVNLSSGIDAVGGSAPTRVLTSKQVGALPTTASISNR